MTTRILTVLSFALAISAFATNARADLYASYDPSNPSVTFPTKVTAFSDVAGQNVWGAEFSPTLTGQVNSLTAAIAVENLVPPGGPATYQFFLFSGAVVDPFNTNPIDVFSQVVNTPGGAISSFTFSSSDHPVITAGNSYWLYMGTSPGEAQPLDWGIPSSTGVVGNVDDASFVGGGATNHSFSTTTQPAFVIDGTATSTTPEPGYTILVGFGIVLLVVLRLKARRRGRVRVA